MKIKYFRDTDTLHIEFRASEVAETQHSPIVHHPAGLQHFDFGRKRQGALAYSQCVALQHLCFHTGTELLHEIRAIAVMHRNRNLRFELT